MSGVPGAPGDLRGPLQHRRERGAAAPERAPPADRIDDTPEREGIEIDNAIERPQVGQPGQPGAKPG